MAYNDLYEIQLEGEVPGIVLLGAIERAGPNVGLRTERVVRNKESYKVSPGQNGSPTVVSEEVRINLEGASIEPSPHLSAMLHGPHADFMAYADISPSRPYRSFSLRVHRPRETSEDVRRFSEALYKELGQKLATV